MNISWQITAPETRFNPADLGSTRLCYDTAAKAFNAEREIAKRAGLGQPGNGTTHWDNPMPWVRADELISLSRTNCSGLLLAIDQELADLQSRRENDPDSISRTESTVAVLAATRDRLFDLSTAHNAIGPDQWEILGQRWARCLKPLARFIEERGSVITEELVTKSFRMALFLVGGFAASFFAPELGPVFAGCIATGADPTKMAKSLK